MKKKINYLKLILVFVLPLLISGSIGMYLDIGLNYQVSPIYWLLGSIGTNISWMLGAKEINKK